MKENKRLFTNFLLKASISLGYEMGGSRKTISNSVLLVLYFLLFKNLHVYLSSVLGDFEKLY